MDNTSVSVIIANGTKVRTLLGCLNALQLRALGYARSSRKRHVEVTRTTQPDQSIFFARFRRSEQFQLASSKHRKRKQLKLETAAETFLAHDVLWHLIAIGLFRALC